NAFEAVAEHQPEGREVVISADVGQDQLEFSVHDSGDGIPADQRDRVFEAFFTTKPGGVGIGLAISRSIIEDHGGRIWVDAGARTGTTFRFTLPLEVANGVGNGNGLGR